MSVNSFRGTATTRSPDVSPSDLYPTKSILLQFEIKSKFTDAFFPFATALWPLKVLDIPRSEMSIYAVTQLEYKLSNILWIVTL